MKKTSILFGALVGALTSLCVIAISLAGAWLFGLPPFPLDLFDWMARTLPGVVIATVINTMVTLISIFHLGPTASTAKLAEQIMGLITFILIGAIFGAVFALVGRRRAQNLTNGGMLAGALLAFVMVLIEASLGFKAGLLVTVIWLGILFLIWGAVLGRLVSRPAAMTQLPTTQTPSEPGSFLSRREFLYLGAASAAAVLVSAIALDELRKGGHIPGETSPTTVSSSTPDLESAIIGEITSPTNLPSQSILAARTPPVPGTRSELTANEDFYRIDINTFLPPINGDNWHLELAGLVNKPLSLSLENIKARPAVSQALTMECISNLVGGDLTSTTIWTGVPLKDILAEADLQPSVKGIYIEAADGFYEFILVADAMDPRTLLVYEMNGAALPAEHGFPLRLYIPNRYGMKMPKWITRMEAAGEERNGYWVDRGWDRDAMAKTTSVIDVVAIDSLDSTTNTIPVGGIAWAGDRGISKVEVRVDKGAWAPAKIRQPPLSPLCWVQWRYDWPAQPGSHRFSVRAYDGTGALQETGSSSPEWSGATGIDSMDAVVIN
jgi:DMSO/TMAO reductase YedYZ molybdopterin-dependent catalytic subunit/uncharacterized membrane protein SirB2